jgi:hypothetical protein
MSTPKSRDKSIIEELSKGLEIERQLQELAPKICSRIKSKRYAQALRGYNERVNLNIEKYQAILREYFRVVPERITLDEKYYGSLARLRRVVSGKLHKGNDRVIIKSLEDIENWRVVCANCPVMIFRLAKSRPAYIALLEPMVEQAIKLRDQLECFDGEMMTRAEHEYWRQRLVLSGMIPPKPGEKIEYEDDDYFPIC